MKNSIAIVASAGLLAAWLTSDSFAQTGSAPAISGRVTIESDAPIKSAINGAPPPAAPRPRSAGPGIRPPSGAAIGQTESGTATGPPTVGIVIGPEGSARTAVILPNSSGGAGSPLGPTTAIIGQGRPPAIVQTPPGKTGR